LFILVLSFNSNVFSMYLYNWSDSEIEIYLDANTNSTVIGQLEVGGKVEKMDSSQKQVSKVESWILTSKESKDTILFTGNMIRIKYNNIIGYCFNTFLIEQEFKELEILKENIVSVFDYYQSINNLKEISREEEKIENGDNNSIDKGRIVFNDNSILTYEYGGSGGGGGIEFLVEGDLFKELLIITLKILTIKPRDFYNIEETKNSIRIEIECESLNLRKVENSRTEFSHYYGC
jgi:hypothetical protein